MVCFLFTVVKLFLGKIVLLKSYFVLFFHVQEQFTTCYSKTLTLFLGEVSVCLKYRRADVLMAKVEVCALCWRIATWHK